MASAKFSVIIPVRNGARTLATCLEHVLALKEPCRVMVVDDGSTDETPQIVSRFRVESIRTQNGGAAQARNLGAKRSESDILVFVDADVYVPQDLLTRVDRAFQGAAPEVAAIQPFYSARSFPHNAASLFKQTAQYRMMHRCEFKELAALGTSCVAIRREVYLALGGFDESIPGATVEDWDLARRLRAAGYRIQAEQGLQVDHDSFATWRGLIREKFERARWFTYLVLSDVNSRGTVSSILRNESYFSPAFVASPLMMLMALGFGVWLGWPGVFALGVLLVLKLWSEKVPSSLLPKFLILKLAVTVSLGMGMLRGSLAYLGRLAFR